jgi:hypothetical protein
VERAASLYSRDVTVGDGVSITDGTTSVETYVTGLVPNVVAATVDATATANTANVDDSVAAAVVVDGSDVPGTIDITADATSYDGRATGDVTEVYTLTCVQGSTGGDFTTARLQVSSASGRDDVALFTPAATGVAKALTARGLEVTIEAGTGPDLTAGMVWEISVTQDYTNNIVITTGGTYNGSKDTTYIITVVEGGDIGDATIAVSTNTGYDTGAVQTTLVATPVSIGNYGVVATFAGSSGLVAGDRYLIEVTAVQDGPIQTVQLANTLPSALDGAVITVIFSMRKDIEITRNRTGMAPLVNFDTSLTEISVKAGIIAYDAAWHDEGTLLPLEVVKGSLYVHYRALIQDFVRGIQTFSDVGELSTYGEVHPDNPFVFAVYKALSNSNGTEVKGVAVATDNFAGYSAALSIIMGSPDVYGIVPLTQDKTIQDLFAAHVLSVSTPENGRWRICWLNSQSAATEAVTVDDDGEPILATITDDPSTSGTQYTKVYWADGKFLTDGVKPTDILRADYRNDGFGTDTYSEYVIDQVISEDTVILLSGPSTEFNIATKIEVWRNNSRDEEAAAYGVLSGSFGTRRVRHIWPDVVGVDGETVPGYHLCAGLAGLQSGVAPHQGLTNVEILGFDDLTRTTEYFSATQLNEMAKAGTWIVTQNANGQVYTRHQLTTGDYGDLNQAEASITTNVDSISYYLLDLFAPYMGKANVTPSFVDYMTTKLVNALDELKNRGFTPELGAQVVDYTIAEIRQHSILKDRIVAVVNLTLPYPFNSFELHLVV